MSSITAIEGGIPSSLATARNVELTVDTSDAIATVAVPVDTHARLTDNHPAFVLALCLAVAVAVIVGLVIGILYRIDGASIAAAFIRGCIAAGSSVVGGATVITLITLMS
ncbi:hypothetical protein AB0H76_13525 [Nocardia sp. NPDC050712]|uniref:hypothetical protein n=1 Tax=Nocardia sp. NPDC050712 TaxID=3155518 RepID=UPI003410167F